MDLLTDRISEGVVALDSTALCGGVIVPVLVLVNVSLDTGGRRGRGAQVYVAENVFMNVRHLDILKCLYLCPGLGVARKGFWAM